MREEEFEIAIKVIIVGNGAVGKSSMIQRYCKGIFTKDYKKTIGVDFLERELEIDGEAVRLMLWDTAGQEEFDSITRAYYRGAQACVLTYSSTDRASFDAVPMWKKKVESEVGSISMVLVHNKIDLRDSCVVSDGEADALAAALRLKLYRTSVKENVNVDLVFAHLAETCMVSMSLHAADESRPQSIGTTVAAPVSRPSGPVMSRSRDAPGYAPDKRNGSSSSHAVERPSMNSAITLRPGEDAKRRSKSGAKKAGQKCLVI